MANKEQLLAEAKDKGLEVPEGATNAEIQKLLEDNEIATNGTTGEGSGEAEDVTPVETEEEKKVREEQEKAAKEADEQEEREAQAAIEEQKRLEEEAKKPSAGSQHGSDIANAIVEGLKATKEDKRIKVVADKSVRPRFSIVKSKKTGEIMLRENESGTLSKVQLESIEEKEASIQGEEVEEL